MYWLIRGLAWLVVRILYRVSYRGGENIPRKGAVLICANHIGWWDPVIAAVAIRRRIYFMGKAELFDNRAFGLLLRSVGAFPVRRGTPDRKALSRALELLKQGQAVGIFPEGTRNPSGQFRRAEPGIGLMVLSSGAPVVPGYFQGPYGFRRPVSLVVGKPIKIDESLTEGKTSGERRQAVADAVMAAVAALGGRVDDYPFRPERSGLALTRKDG